MVAPSRKCATLTSDICLSSSLSDPSLFNPTFISKVDLDGLETTGNGPTNF